MSTMDTPKPSDIITPENSHQNRGGSPDAGQATAAPAPQLESSSQRAYGYKKLRVIGLIMLGVGVLACAVVLVGYFFPSLIPGSSQKEARELDTMLTACRTLRVSKEFTIMQPCETVPRTDGKPAISAVWRVGVPMTYADMVKKVQGIASSSGYHNTGTPEDGILTADAPDDIKVEFSLDQVGHSDTGGSTVYSGFTASYTAR